MLDKIFYINLNKREDRKEHIINMFKECGVDDSLVERFPAIEDITNGALGCTKSHICVLDIAKTRGYEYILIVEDDIYITDRNKFKENIEKIFESNVNFDIIKISGNVLNSKPTTVEFLDKVIDSQTTSGYIVNCKYIDKLRHNYIEAMESMIRFGRRHENCIDINWKKLQKNDNWFIFNPKLGFQMDGYSDIEKKNVKYNC